MFGIIDWRSGKREHTRQGKKKTRRTDGRDRKNSSRSGIRNKRDSHPLKFVETPARSGGSTPTPVPRQHVPQHCLIKVQLKEQQLACSGMHSVVSWRRVAQCCITAWGCTVLYHSVGLHSVVSLRRMRNDRMTAKDGS